MFSMAIVVNVWAQGTLKGKITDEKTGETLVGVTLSVLELKTVGTASDEDGEFELKLPEGTYTVQVRYLGYTTKEVSGIKVDKASITPLNVAIK